MALNLKTPGVYIEEKNAFPGSVVEVATAIPAFIGYTEKASRNGKTLANKPTRITSIQEYINLFGGAYVPKFTLETITDGKIADETTPKHEITINGESKAIVYATDHDAYMFRGIQLFFNNGGGACYIVSVGTYGGKDKDGKDKVVNVVKDELEAGLTTLLKEQEPTMVLVPDVVKLKDDSYDVYKKVLAHCAKMQSRFAIVDIYNGDEERIVSSDPKVDIIGNFREKIGSEYLNYAAAYYPWLNTNIVQKGDVTFENIITGLEKLLPKSEEKALELVTNFPKDTATFMAGLKKEKPSEFKKALQKDLDEGAKLSPAVGLPADLIEPAAVAEPTAVKEPKLIAEPDVVTEPTDPGEGASPDDLEQYKADDEKYQTYLAKLKVWENYKTAKSEYDDYLAKQSAYEEYLPKLKSYLEKLIGFLETHKFTEVLSLQSGYIKNKKRNYHLGLVATSPTYVNLLDEIRAVMNLLPPSSAMAGIYTMVDNNRGVWKSPANISLNSVVQPSANITHDDQENLNVDAISGKSINAIRTFPGIGTLVWGGRTLDGNSLDWQYINVRRTMIMLEQSIKLALRSYVFEPNDANTWVTVKSMIYNFLNEKWKQGALAGSSPDDAFNVQVGLGSTMTSLDILEGKMLVSVKLAIVRPAEFIVVTFEQQMQKS